MDLMIHERRFLATLIDGSLIATLTFVLGFFHNIPFFSYDYYFFYGFTIFMMIYQFLNLIILKNKTIGMLCVGVRVLSKNKENMNLRQIILRTITISIPILFIVNMGYVFLNRDSTTIFDVISDSMVLDTGINYGIKKNK